MCAECEKKYGWRRGDFAISRNDLRTFAVIDLGQKGKTLMCVEVDHMGDPVDPEKLNLQEVPVVDLVNIAHTKVH